jgi:hypothetical protein
MSAGYWELGRADGETTLRGHEKRAGPFGAGSFISEERSVTLQL